MKNVETVLLTILFTLTLAANATAGVNSKKLNSLGANEALMQKAEPTVPHNTYRIVQKRVIDRITRLEVSVNSGLVNGGDSYYLTNSTGAQMEFHINHRWSIGGRFAQFTNELTREGKNQLAIYEAKHAAGDPRASFPNLDFPQSQYVATISYYPLYGKMSLFDASVSYFDLYILAGAGKMQLLEGESNLATGGVGFGMWWNQHITSRIEVRYQQYKDQGNRSEHPEGRQIGNTIAFVGMGFLI